MFVSRDRGAAVSNAFVAGPPAGRYVSANGELRSAGKHSDSCFVDLHDFEYEAVGRPEECYSSGTETGVNIPRRDQYFGSQGLDFLELAVKIIHFIHGVSQSGPDFLGYLVFKHYLGRKDEHAMTTKLQDDILTAVGQPVPQDEFRAYRPEKLHLFVKVVRLQSYVPQPFYHWSILQHAK